MAGIMDKIKAKLPGHKDDPVVHTSANTPGYHNTTNTTGLTTGNQGTGYGTGTTAGTTGTTGTTSYGTGRHETMGERIQDAVTPGHKTAGTGYGTTAATGTGLNNTTGTGTGYNTAGTGYGTTAGTTGYGTTTGHKETVGEKIKDAVGLGHRHDHHHAHTGHGAHGEKVGMMGAGTGTVGTTMTRKGSDTSSSSSSDGDSPRMSRGVVPTAAGGVLGQQTYSTVEEAATIKEHVQVIREHHPVQHNYVVETKEVGVRELPAKIESLGVTERVLEETPVRGHAHVAPLTAAGLQGTTMQGSTTTTTTHGGMQGMTQGMTGNQGYNTVHDTRTTHELK